MFLDNLENVWNNPVTKNIFQLKVTSNMSFSNTFWNQFFKSYSLKFLIFVPYLQGDHELQKKPNILNVVN